MKLFYHGPIHHVEITNKGDKFVIKQNKRIIAQFQACLIFDLLSKTMSPRSKSPGVARRAKAFKQPLGSPAKPTT